MRTPRVYTAQAIEPHSRLELGSEASHYLLKVLRMQEGRELILFNGEGSEFPAMLSAASKKMAVLDIGEQRNLSKESPLYTELAIGLSKGERMDWVIQKATELGVTKLVPLLTERTEVKLKGDRLDKRIHHWKQIAISTCEQCQRNILPFISSAMPFEDYLAYASGSLKLVLHHRSEVALNAHPQPESVSLLVGPEGGLSEQEIQRALTKGFKPLTLGPRVLRTETAPLAALAVLQSHWGDI